MEVTMTEDEFQERHYDYMLRRMREEDKKTEVASKSHPKDKFDPDVHGGGVEDFSSYYPGGRAQE